jgi:hypothetical protein
MSWVTPITNRTSTSKYNATDINRIVDNIIYLQSDILSNLLNNVTLPYTISTQTTSSLGYASLINHIEANINVLYDYFNSTFQNWVTLLETWSGNSYSFMYTNANNLELNLLILYTNLQQMKAFLDFYRCGSSRVICGGGFPTF